MFVSPRRTSRQLLLGKQCDISSAKQAASDIFSAAKFAACPCAQLQVVVMESSSNFMIAQAEQTRSAKI
jgi:hypothetical protein